MPKKAKREARGFLCMSAALMVLIAFPICAATNSTMEKKLVTDHSVQAVPPLILIDAHEDVIQRVFDRGHDLADPNAGGQADIPSWIKGGVNAPWFSIWIDPRTFRGHYAVDRANSLLSALRDQARKHADILTICDTSADVRAVTAAGKIAGLIGIEGGGAINNNLSLIEDYRRQHVRYMTLTWRGNLSWAGSSQSDDPTMGLTDFGKSVVREMNRVGMLIDLSHVSDQTFYDAIKESSRPVIVSHSNCRALADHPRNVTDDMLRALKKNNGVIGINFASEFLHGKDPDDHPTVETLLDHIDHIVKIAGIDHAGIGSDWDGGIRPPAGLETAAGMPNLIKGLRKRGYSETDIRKIAGENFLRVLEASEK